MPGLTQALAESFRALHTRTVTAPWIGPKGQTWELEIRPHDDPAYQSALQALGVVPLSVAERQRKRPKQAAFMRQAGLPLSAEDQALSDQIDRDEAEIVRTGFPWDTYPPTYSLAEVEKVAEAVCAHLVVSARESLPSPSAENDAPEKREIGREELIQWFAEKTPLPYRMPSGGSSPAAEIAKALAALRRSGRREEVYLGGVSEGVALAAFVLCESLLAHEFQELLDPLLKSSVSTQDGAATTTPPRASQEESGPSSPARRGGARTSGAPARASSGSPATAGPATA